MTDEEVRALVRAAIQKHLGPLAPSAVEGLPAPMPPAAPALPAATMPVAMAFGRYRLERAPDDTMCIIEPAVRCNHCGFCQSHGH